LSGLVECPELPGQPWAAVPEALATQGRLWSQEGLLVREEKSSSGMCAVASRSGAAGFGAH